MMNQFPLFSNGLELSNLVMNSDVVHHAWEAIFNLSGAIDPIEEVSLPFSVRCRGYEYPESDVTIIAFVTSPICTQVHLQDDNGDLVSSSVLKASFPVFDFLCTKESPSFSIHNVAVKLFALLYHNNVLSQLKTQYGSSKSLIITGHSLGGSIASLFTLWLLESIDPKTTKLPLCITFGSPLLGNIGLQHSISQYSDWNSCFLHIVSDQDPIPRFFISTSSHLSDYKPFGTFLLCADSGCACFSDPESVLELLAATNVEAGNQDPFHDLKFVHYGPILGRLKCKVLFKDTAKLGVQIDNPFQAGIIAQLEAIGLVQTQQHQYNIDMNALVTKMEENIMTHKRNDLDPSKKLNDMKIYMAHLEWYKKTCKARGNGYYDSYKNKQMQRDHKVVEYKKRLENYWIDMVEQVERKPQKEGASLRKRWLYGGTNYRRMVEPLEIAEYYKDGSHKDYKSVRSKHYKLLEEWMSEVGKPTNDSNNAKRMNIASSLTEDSCFWANVEEAILLSKLVKFGGPSGDVELAKQNLIEFENYVMGLIKNYEVSPEIFLDQSSFMKWWREYEVVGGSIDSEFCCFMKNGGYHQYADGSLVFT